MIYLTVGLIVVLISLWLSMSVNKLLGIIVFIIGGAIGLKGRRELDKFKGGKL